MPPRGRAAARGGCGKTYSSCLRPSSIVHFQFSIVNFQLAGRRSTSACASRRGLSPQKGGDPTAGSPTVTLLRLHPNHRPHLRRAPPSRVGWPPSGAEGFRDVTGGVYKARERIHGAVADAPLLANPASRGRVADRDPNWGGFWGLAPPRGLASLCARHCSTCAARGVRAILT